MFDVKNKIILWHINNDKYKLCFGPLKWLNALLINGNAFYAFSSSFWTNGGKVKAHLCIPIE